MYSPATPMGAKPPKLPLPLTLSLSPFPTSPGFLPSPGKRYVLLPKKQK